MNAIDIILYGVPIVIIIIVMIIVIYKIAKWSLKLQRELFGALKGGSSMKVYLIRDMNYGNIQGIYLNRDQAEIMLKKAIFYNEKNYNNRYNWKIEEWAVK